MTTFIHRANYPISLTKREQQILSLILMEMSSKEIGEVLNISSRTVECHRKNMLNKCNVKNSVGLVKLFYQQKFNMQQTKKQESTHILSNQFVCYI
jgi:DNA-binding CsgD family transcriptional regulator